MGLAISSELVRGMGGEIGLESIVGVGSTFWVTIPFEKQTQKDETDFKVTSTVELDDIHILGVDDNATNRFILTKMVEGFGCRIETATDGRNALEMIRNAENNGDPFRIVLLDMQMPGMDGEQTARAIKADPASQNIDIVILTSIGERGDAARLSGIGCSGYLLKPVKQELLRDALFAILSQKQMNAKQGQFITRHSLKDHKRQEMSILLAEDNHINQKLAKTVVQNAGFMVDVVENGEHAIERLKRGKYNAVLMDIQMPELDGIQTTRKWRKLEAGRERIPIIAMTAHALKGDRERCLEAGMDDYISKPLDSKELIKILDRWTVPKVEPEAMLAPEIVETDLDVDDENVDFTDGLFGEEAAIEEKKLGLETASTSREDGLTDQLPINVQAGC